VQVTTTAVVSQPSGLTGTDAMIEVEDLSKAFGSVQALVGVSLHVQAGRVLGLLGPNGAGKTTLVRILATLLQPDSGHARVAGLDIVRDAVALRSAIGLAGQYAAVDELLTGRENLELVGQLYHRGRAERRQRAERVLEQFELAGAADRPVRTYSAACGGGWTWPPAWSASRRCSSWTSRPAAWIRARAWTCGSTSRTWWPAAPPSC
jgi:ABC-type polysaccharide/polyol phosphate transport system ATPase subunit